MSSEDAIWSANFNRRYVSQAADVDLVTESQVTNAQNIIETAGSLCRWIRSKSAGTIVIVSARGENIDLDFAAGETRFIRARKIYGTGSANVPVQGAGNRTVTTTSTDFEVMW